MGGSSKSQTVGYWYKVLYHAGLGIGPIDAFLEFRGGDKPAWKGELTASGTIAINARNLWGGEKDQGGIVSGVDVMFGEAGQVPNAYLLANLGDQVPAWRGLATLVFKGGLYGAMNPYPQKASYKIRKILQGWDGECWYPETASITTDILLSYDAYCAGADGGPDIDYRWAMSGNYTAIGVSEPNIGHAGTMPLHARESVTSLSSSQPPLVHGTADAASIKKGAALNSHRAGVLIDGSETFSIGGWFRISGAENAVGLIKTNAGRDGYRCGIHVRVIPDVADGYVIVSPSRGASGTNKTYSSAAGTFALNTINFVVVRVTPAPNTEELVLALFVNGIEVPLTPSGADHAVDWNVSVGSEEKGVSFSSSDGQSNGSAYGGYDDLFVHFGLLTDEQIAEMDRRGRGAYQPSGWMNPAHVLYYARTNSDIGRESTANMNDASYRAAAETLYDERFGICTSFDPSQESLEEFEKRICKVIGGSVSRSIVDGQWYLDLARSDYVLEDLPILTDDDILDFSELSSTLDGGINSLSVTYFDPDLKEEITTPPAQALALIDSFGTIHQTTEYLEIPDAQLAARVAERDLRATVTPTRVFDLVTTRKPYAWRPGQYFRLQGPKRGIADMVCIVGEKQTGTLKSGAIKLKASQDIYSLQSTAYVEIESGVDTRPSQIPVPITLQRAFEAPYIEIVQALSRADLAVLPDDAGYLLTVAKDPATSRDYTVRVAPDGVTYAETARGDWCPTAMIVEAAEYLDEAFTFTGGSRLDEVVLGQAALWDEEIVRVDALDMVAGAVTVARGCADTVPQLHAAGSRIWFYDDSAAVDVTEYTADEMIIVKLLTNTGSQRLADSAASAMSVDFDSRQARPYPPAYVQLDGAPYPAQLELAGDLTVTAYHRNRLAQADQLFDQSIASIGPEPGTTYVVRNVDADTETETYLASGITDWPHTVPAASLAARNRLEVYSVRDGLESWQRQVREFEYPSREAILWSDGEAILWSDGEIVQEA